MDSLPEEEEVEILPSVAVATVPPVAKDPPAQTEDSKPTRVNSYAAKKSVAQRMMDIALLTSNANQLRYVLRFGENSATFAVAVVMISVSLVLQVAVGIYLIFRVKQHSTQAEKDQAHNIVVAGVFLITIVNVLVTAFSLEPAPTAVLATRLGFNDTGLD